MFVFYAVMTISFRYEDLSGMNIVSVVATLLVVVFFQGGPGRKMSKIFGIIIQQIVTLSKYGHDSLNICHL